MSDHFAALRSANGWFTFVILSALVCTVVFNLFFTLKKVDDVSIKGSPVSVVASYNGAGELSRGDVALIKEDDGYICVRVKKVTDEGVTALRGNAEVVYPFDVVVGKARFLVQPLIVFGGDPIKACAEF